MSSRRLGGGRILGSGKGLAPPPPAHAPRAASPFAPSDSSTISFNSPNSISPPSSSPLPEASQDLASNISLGRPANGAASAAASTRLVCPICDEEMVTLLQLNRHIDDAHQELPEAEQDEVKTWFDKQVHKAKRFQPLTILNQKLRGLDVFESNDLVPLPATAAAGLRPAESGFIDPEELVTRKHWQRPTGNDICTDPPCGTRLGPLSGSINCRMCGRLFCEEHTMYQMKLSRAAKHDPVRGYWCRVCETCYKSRAGYNDHSGLLRDHTDTFVAIRRRRVDRQNLEIQRLEKRLTKLTGLLADAPEDVAAGGGGGGLLAPVAALPGQRNQRKLIEQSVVAWEDDASVSKCPFCKQEFGSWTFRRHHCRICGRVVCSDLQTGCSSEVGLNVASPTSAPSEKPAQGPGAQLSLDIRMCRDCKTTLFSKRDFTQSIAHKPPDQRAYETLGQFERGIRQLLPSFQRALLALQTTDDDRHQARPPPTRAQIQEAAKIRKRLIDSFTKYDVAARRIRDMKPASPTQLRLQKAVYAAASSFLHAYMLPLKSVPRMLQSQSSGNHRRLLAGLNGSSSSLSSSSAAAQTLSPLRNGESAGADPETASLGGASEASTSAASAAALELEEKEVREKLIVLEEQRFLVRDMIANARGSRRFEEVTALTRNLEELDGEIEELGRRVSGVEERWEGLYATGLQ